MRITGWVLLVVGVLLCVSIAWATIGFLMMGLGLILYYRLSVEAAPSDAAARR